VKLSKSPRTGRTVIRLGAADTKLWEDAGSNGHAFRAKVRRTAEDAATKDGKFVEIYASEKKGGWMADQVQPRDLPPGTSRG
jgi:hypothetical protein